ncbi:MAG: hypothetical protein NC548_41325 [Lachnospiraceae bacterium]|nr:hypothetical protein [Lachnospiraceae bacterium]
MLTTDALETRVKTPEDGYAVLYEEITGKSCVGMDLDTVRRVIDKCLYTLFDWEWINNHPDKFSTPTNEPIKTRLIDRKTLAKPYAACLWLRYGLSGDGVYSYLSVGQFVNFQHLWLYDDKRGWERFGRIREQHVTAQNWIAKAIKLMQHPVYINLLCGKLRGSTGLCAIVNQVCPNARINVLDVIKPHVFSEEKKQRYLDDIVGNRRKWEEFEKMWGH